MNRQIKVLRIEIGGRWLAAEFADGIRCFSELYNLRMLLQLMRERRRNFYRRGTYWGPDPFELDPELFGSNAPGYFLTEDLVGPRQNFWVNLLSYDVPAEKLAIRRIEYASPGITDLAGVGAIIGHIKDFVTTLINRHDSKRRRQLDDEHAELENDQLRIQNAREFVSLARDLDFSPLELRRLISYVDERQEIVDDLIIEKKILGVRILDNEEDNDSR